MKAAAAAKDGLVPTKPNQKKGVKILRTSGDETVWTTVFVDRTTEGVWEKVSIKYVESSQELLIFFPNSLQNKEHMAELLRGYSEGIVRAPTGQYIIHVTMPNIGHVAVTRVSDDQTLYDFGVVSFQKVLPDFALITRSADVKDAFDGIFSEPAFRKADYKEELAIVAYRGLKRPCFFMNTYCYEHVGKNMVEQLMKLNRFLMSAYIMEGMPNIALDAPGYE